MRIINDINSLRGIIFQYKIEKKTIGLVPTMGALHSGHVALIDASINDCDITVCSVYVNPTQFNNPSDLEKYPKTIESDFLLLEQSGCDIAFCPDNSAMYPQANILSFDFGTLDKTMEGEFRSGHFSGVATIVSKLLNIVRPSIAYFGQKDLQQFAIINKLVQDLSFDTQVKCVPIAREKSGLALSSRNMRLTDQGKVDAIIFHKSLLLAKDELVNGESISQVKNKVQIKFASSVVKLEYFEVVDKTSLKPVDVISDKNLIAICIAGYVENVRLLDNIFLK